MSDRSAGRSAGRASPAPVGRSSISGVAGKKQAVAPKKPSDGKPTRDKFDPIFRGESPTLWSCDTVSLFTGAPLLPDPPPAGTSSEDRFCTEGPIISIPGANARRHSGSSGIPLTFTELVSRIDNAAGQASVLLNDRIVALERRQRGSELPPDQIEEICNVADGVLAATYYAQKWAHILNAEEIRKPFKPEPCSDLGEAFASMHYAIPWLMISAKEVRVGLAKAIADHGEGAEARMLKKGIGIEDLRAFAPHLEQALFRINRLSSSLRPVSSSRKAESDEPPPRLEPEVAEIKDSLDIKF